MEYPKNLKHLFFVDIETVSAASSFEELEKPLQNLWKKKSKVLDPEKEIAASFFEKAGLYAEFGKIIVIGIGMFYINDKKDLCFKASTLTAKNEKKLLLKFKDIISKTDQANLRFVAHNGKEFDYPYLSRRMLINGVNLPDCLDVSYKKPWEINHLDTMAMWKFGDWKSYTSLELLAAVFGIESNNNDMDGSMVNKVYYEEKNISKIVEYCLNDVVTTARLYLKLNGLEDLNSEFITKES